MQYHYVPSRWIHTVNDDKVACTQPVKLLNCVDVKCTWDNVLQQLRVQIIPNTQVLRDQSYFGRSFVSSKYPGFTAV